VIIPFAQWPNWLQVVVLVPHGLFGFIATWFWWPRSEKGWKRFGIVAAYLFVFFLVMRFAFNAR
jgi:hypothetical protein